MNLHTRMYGLDGKTLTGRVRLAALSVMALGCVVMPAGLKAQETALAILPAAAPAVVTAGPVAAASEDVPDAPSTVAGLDGQTPNGPASSNSGQPHQTKRILGIVPNFRAVSADQKLPPQTVKQKFMTTFQQSFDYSSFLFVGVQAGIQMGENNTPEFHQGGAGYGRYYWHVLADQTDENLWVQAILPSALHEDSRYYTLGHGGFLKRTGYAVSRIAITRDDDGGEGINFSEIVGAGAASGISDLYYPQPEKTWTKTGQRWALNVGIDGGVFLFQEFWPNINAKLFHQKD